MRPPCSNRYRKHAARSSAPLNSWSEVGEGAWASSTSRSSPQPVRRKVALKVIKPGMDTRQVIARFEAERQALAMMDHPNIAKVHDGGTTESGRPYFVMELVRGLPVTEYCDGERLAIQRDGWSCSCSSAARTARPTKRALFTAI